MKQKLLKMALNMMSGADAKPTAAAAWNMVEAFKSSLTDDEEDCATCVEMLTDFQTLLTAKVGVTRFWTPLFQQVEAKFIISAIKGLIF